MTNTNWPPPIDGPTMRSFKARGIDPKTMVFFCNIAKRYRDWTYFHDEAVYKLPANSIYYIVKAHNEEHGTSFVPWFGGDRAPDDWDASKPVLFPNGVADTSDIWDWSHSDGLVRTNSIIIGYTPKLAVETVRSFENTAWLAKMTFEEAIAWASERWKDTYSQQVASYVLNELGLIIPDAPETPADRYAKHLGRDLTDAEKAVFDFVEWGV